MRREATTYRFSHHRGRTVHIGEVKAVAEIDLVIRNVRLVSQQITGETDGEITSAAGNPINDNEVNRWDIAVAGEKIVEIRSTVSQCAENEIDGTGLTAFPGLIDSHVHLNDPGRDHWEGGRTGSSALAAGGVTCFADMPLNSSPPTLTADAFDAKCKRLSETSRIDFALWGGLTPQNIDHMDELAERGVIGFKAFMCPSGIEDFCHADDLTLLRGMERAAKLKLPVAVHAENAALTGALSADFSKSGRTDAEAFFESRPVVAELEAIQRAILYARETGCALHIVHVSSAQGIAMVRDAVHRQGIDVTCETCPHYLMFTAADAARIGPAAKCAPPLRSEMEREELLTALKRGQIDLVGSDHSPSPAGMKMGKSFVDAWGGIAGAQMTLRALLTLGVSEAQVLDLMGMSPATRFALARKGRLAPGYDADIVLVNPGAPERPVTKIELCDRHRTSAWIGVKLRGSIEFVFRRGELIRQGSIWCNDSCGRFVKSFVGEST